MANVAISGLPNLPSINGSTLFEVANPNVSSNSVTANQIAQFSANLEYQFQPFTGVIDPANNIILVQNTLTGIVNTITSGQIISQLNWFPLTINSPWTNFGSVFEAPRQAIGPDGIVHLSGFLAPNGGDINNNVFAQLASNCIPTNTVSITVCIGNANVARIEIRGVTSGTGSKGNVVFTDSFGLGTASFLSLGSIMFSKNN